MKWNITRKNSEKNPLARKSLFEDHFNLMQKNINDMFENFFNISPLNFTDTQFSPSVDINEDEKMITVKAELPGLEEKDIDVTLKDNTLTIRGEKKNEHEEKSKKLHLKETSYGCFERTFTLPEEIVAENIKATYKNGVLEFEIPKDTKKAPKQISVKVE